jgi:hypothetical protein
VNAELFHLSLKQFGTIHRLRGTLWCQDIE